MVAGLPQHNLIKLLPATPSGISLYREPRGSVAQRPGELDAEVFLYLSQYFSASQRSQDECFEIFSGLCITGFSSQLVLSANIIHHHKLNLQIEFSALCSQE